MRKSSVRWGQWTVCANLGNEKVILEKSTLVGSVHWQRENPDRNFNPSPKQVEDVFNALKDEKSEKVQVETKTPPIEHLKEKVSSAQFQKLSEIIKENDNLFMQDKYNFGYTDKLKHRI